jgi:hypothetical protein
MSSNLLLVATMPSSSRLVPWLKCPQQRRHRGPVPRRWGLCLCTRRSASLPQLAACWETGMQGLIGMHSPASQLYRPCSKHARALQRPQAPRSEEPLDTSLKCADCRRCGVSQHCPPAKINGALTQAATSSLCPAWGRGQGGAALVGRRADRLDALLHGTADPPRGPIAARTEWLGQVSKNTLAGPRA